MFFDCVFFILGGQCCISDVEQLSLIDTRITAKCQQEINPIGKSQGHTKTLEYNKFPSTRHT